MVIRSDDFALAYYSKGSQLESCQVAILQTDIVGHYSGKSDNEFPG